MKKIFKALAQFVFMGIQMYFGWLALWDCGLTDNQRLVIGLAGGALFYWLQRIAGLLVKIAKRTKQFNVRVANVALEDLKVR